MRFAEWEPVYERICDDFGYDRAGDEAARDELAALFADVTPFDPTGIGIEGQTVAIAGAGPTLESDAALAREADVVLAASVAADRLQAIDIRVDCMVTDLDKNPETVRALTEAETPVAVHAHGDNREAIARIVPDLHTEWVIPTTQAEPVGPLRNDGGFTDGDRAAFLADALGADRLVFPGWTFDDSTVGPEKAKKLRWAERLLYWLERRRGERFAVLNGRRDGIDAEWLS
ncbi:6-hydroxymethylpterin diphosphokinase MptE-like protein [Halovenus marina]|uniref:6-hydroxymethylpterin diphosphokinase MptE-like protein n=1 Tax=Halovenus marina TaxID=3396621 RepID=UPI003F565391